ncbi:MAG: hypothetical protein IT379_18215 [Deltaproteobacteria bacterium]|nr:hypothetical protein [Deltaproteobacteria bacterium]
MAATPMANAPLGRTGPLVDPRVPAGFGPPGAPPPFGQDGYAVQPSQDGGQLAGIVLGAPEAEAGQAAPLQAHIFPGAHPFSQYPGVADPSVDALETSGKTKKKGGRGCAVFLLVSGLILLLGAGGAFAYFVWLAPKLGRGVTASVVRDASGAEEIAVEVAGAAAGTKVRLAGQERVVTGGRARFPMPATQLRIGENQLSLEVLRPNKAAKTHRVQLVVDYRVRADLAALAATPPGYDVVVDAAPGTRVQVDGRAVTLDAAGHGTQRVVLSAVPGSQDGTAALVHTLRYRIEPNGGAPSDGVLTTQIPRTTLTVDRPGPETITDRPEIVVAGATEDGATVTIDGAAVAVQAGRFSHPRPLGAGEASISVRATAPGKAPSVTALRVRRVADLEAEARAFPADAEVTYARLAVNPNLYRGRRAAFQGLVYNMRVEQGQTIIQLLVRDCPQGQRCALWVVFHGDTDATVGTQVRVLGSVAGEQTFRTPQGAQVTVPRLDAALVLAVRS